MAKRAKSISLPRQIALLATITFIFSVTTLWASLYSVREAMNADAAAESKLRIESRMEALQEQVSNIASDYHNWTDLFLDAHKLDYKSLASNYGVTAERGDIFQFAEMFDGPFATAISWQKGQGLEPQAGFLKNSTQDQVRKQVRKLDASQRETFDYYAFRDGRLIIFSSSKLLPERFDLLDGLHLEDQPIAVIGKILSEGRLSDISLEFGLRNLVVNDKPELSNGVQVSVKGVFGKPIAWLQWQPPVPGTVLFRKMAPIISMTCLLLAILFWVGAKLLRDRAAKLIDKEAASSEQARMDALTGIPNRFALFEHFESIAAVGNISCAIIVMDLDEFKIVNDTVGHFGGDKYLQILASRLSLLVDETTFVARLGGDEFVIVITSDKDLFQKTKHKQLSLERVLTKQIECKGMYFDVLASKGMATVNAKEFCGQELLRRADFALYVAKNERSQEIIVYDSKMEVENKESQIIENQLRSALVGRDEFSISYQPIVLAGDIKEINRYEALARWQCKDLGAVPPDKFIHVAEKSGLIIPLGWLLLDIICYDERSLPNVTFSINISPIQLMTPGFASMLVTKLENNGVSPLQIQIEVTEQIAIRDEIKIFQELTNLSNFGFKLALDDFGTGYASISYLTKMPFDIIKIDRSFVKLRAESAQSERMIRSIMRLAQSMDLEIVLEGIETQEEAVWSRSLGADFLQGYLFGHPAPLSNNVRSGKESGKKEIVLAGELEK
jgi:diguanylate cyclase (GGDEF)-like protein